jgi:adenylate cyclase, class 2
VRRARSRTHAARLFRHRRHVNFQRWQEYCNRRPAGNGITGPAPMANRNIELKARYANLQRAAEVASSVGATRAGELRQLDTYFRFPHGRLKLRETEGRGAELIAYERADDPAFCGSDYYVIPVSHPADMKAALAKKLGVRGEVRKRRELFLWHNVRIHLDDVAGLGTFIEFEAVIGPDDEVVSLERLARLTEAMSIRDEDRIAVSYSDLAGL